MNKINLETLYVMVAAFVVNKFLLFWLISTTNRILTMGLFVLVVMNFLILAKSFDKVMISYQLSKKQKNNSMM